MKISSFTTHSFILYFPLLMGREFHYRTLLSPVSSPFLFCYITLEDRNTKQSKAKRWIPYEIRMQFVVVWPLSCIFRIRCWYKSAAKWKQSHHNTFNSNFIREMEIFLSYIIIIQFSPVKGNSIQKHPLLSFMHKKTEKSTVKENRSESKEKRKAKKKNKKRKRNMLLLLFLFINFSMYLSFFDLRKMRKR